MNTQRILRHLVQIALMAGTVCLLPSVHAKSVAAVGALAPVTAPSQELMRDVPFLVAPGCGQGCRGSGSAGRVTPSPHGAPLLVAPSCAGSNCTRQGMIGQAQPSTQRGESFDTAPLLMAPNCGNGNCRPTQNIGQAQPPMQPDASFDPTPVLVAPDCGSGNCRWFRFFG